jgi:hypothetical protein
MWLQNNVLVFSPAAEATSQQDLIKIKASAADDSQALEDLFACLGIHSCDGLMMVDSDDLETSALSTVN